MKKVVFLLLALLVILIIGQIYLREGFADDSNKPSAPTNVKAVPSDGKITVSWDASSTTGITKYIIYDGSIDDSKKLGESTTSPKEITANIKNNTTYNIIVVAQKEIPAVAATGTTAAVAASTSTSVASSPSVKVTPKATPTNAEPPTSITAKSIDGNISVSWTAPTNDGGNSILNYKIYNTKDDGTKEVLGESKTSPFELKTGIKYNTEYKISVTTITAAGEGSASTPIVSITPKKKDETVTLTIKDIMTMFTNSTKEKDKEKEKEEDIIKYIIQSPSPSYDSQFRKSLIKDVKDVVREELLQGGAAQAAALGAPYGGVGEDTVLTDSCIDSFSSQQGADFMKYIPGKNPADYVRKDSIPCYGCSLPTN